MRIGTIHAFCQSLLRRFPLEARAVAAFPAGGRHRRRRGAARRRARTCWPRPTTVLAARRPAGACRPCHRRPVRQAGGEPAGRPGPAGAGAGAWPGRSGRGAAAGCWAPNRTRPSCWHARSPGRQNTGCAAPAASWPNAVPTRSAERALRMLDWLALPGEMRAETWPEWRCEFLLEDLKPRGLGALINPQACKGTVLKSSMPWWPSSSASSPSRIAGGPPATRRSRRRWPTSPVRWWKPMPAARTVAALLDYDDLIARSSTAAGRPRRRLGAVQVGRRAGPSAAGRGAGHRARAVAHRRRADRGVLRRRGRARRGVARCSRSATASSRSTRSRAPTRTSSNIGAACCASACGDAGKSGGT